MTTRPSFNHLPALDGLRGLAVMGVVWFHLGGRAGQVLRGGYLGVDLFFVLSGFLITNVLLAEYRKRGRIDLGNFWVRRARRLLPAMLSLIPAIAIYAWKFARTDELTGIRKDALATLAYVANWRAIFSEKSYWDLFAAPSPLEHTWSLAIEEQFYVVWPLLFLFAVVTLRLGRRALIALSLVLALASCAAMVWFFSPAHTSRAYFGTDTRAASILVGAALAFALEGRDLGRFARALDGAGIFAALLLGVAWVRLDGQNPWLYRGGFWITELACLVVVACSTLGDRSLVARALTQKPLIALGKASYGIYLWHWPIFCVITPERVHLNAPLIILVRLGLTLAIAALSYRYVEQPIRVHGLRVRFPTLAVVASYTLCIGLVVLATRPRFPHQGPLDSLWNVVNRRPDGQPWATAFSLDLKALPPKTELPPGTLRIFTVGDSVSQKLGNAMRIHQMSANAWVADRGVGDCSIMERRELVRGAPLGHPDPASGCAAHWAADTAELKPDITFLIFGGAYLHDMTLSGVHENACGEGYRAAYRARLEQLLEAMGKNAGTVVMALAPYPGERWRHDDLLDDVDCYNAFTREFSANHHLATVDVAHHLCPGAPADRACQLLSEGEPIRPDGLHPECPGANELAQWTLKQLVQIAQNPAQ